MIDRLSKLIASVFYIGYAPVAPGSVGSLAALFLYYFIKNSNQLMGGAIILTLILGLFTARRAERLFGSKDSGEIIIDEFAGMLIALFLLPVSTWYVIAAFILFRFFDIKKPKPIKQIEKLNGSLGIMLDDVVAGVYANLVLQIVYRVLQ